MLSVAANSLLNHITHTGEFHLLPILADELDASGHSGVADRLRAGHKLTTGIVQKSLPHSGFPHKFSFIRSYAGGMMDPDRIELHKNYGSDSGGGYRAHKLVLFSNGEPLLDRHFDSSVPTIRFLESLPQEERLRLDRYKAPAGGTIINNQFYQGGKFLPKILESIRKVRNRKLGLSLAKGDWTPLSDVTARHKNVPLSKVLQVKIGALQPLESNQDESLVDEYTKEMKLAPESFQAIVAKKSRVPGKLDIVDGHHRYKAAIKNGMTHVPVRLLHLSKWDKESAEPVSGGFKVIGSVANKGSSAHDLDLLAPDNYDIELAHGPMKSKGFEYHGSSVMSPEEAKKAGKQFDKTQWSRIHHYRHKDGRKLEIWSGEGNLELSRDSQAAEGLWPHVHEPGIAEILADHLEESNPEHPLIPLLRGKHEYIEPQEGDWPDKERKGDGSYSSWGANEGGEFENEPGRSSRIPVTHPHIHRMHVMSRHSNKSPAIVWHTNGHEIKTSGVEKPNIVKILKYITGRLELARELPEVTGPEHPRGENSPVHERKFEVNGRKYSSWLTEHPEAWEFSFADETPDVGEFGEEIGRTNKAGFHSAKVLATAASHLVHAVRTHKPQRFTFSGAKTDRNRVDLYSHLANELLEYLPDYERAESPSSSRFNFKRKNLNLSRLIQPYNTRQAAFDNAKSSGKESHFVSIDTDNMGGLVKHVGPERAVQLQNHLVSIAHEELSKAGATTIHRGGNDPHSDEHHAIVIGPKAHVQSAIDATHARIAKLGIPNVPRVSQKPGPSKFGLSLFAEPIKGTLSSTEQEAGYGIETQKNRKIGLAKGWESVHNETPSGIEGWIDAEGTYHPNDPADPQFYRHLKTLTRLGYKNSTDAFNGGLMHVGSDWATVYGHRDDRTYTKPQIAKLKEIADAHGLHMDVSRKSLELARFKLGLVKSEAELQSRLREHPYDQVAYMWNRPDLHPILADWLEERGDPLGPVVRRPKVAANDIPNGPGPYEEYPLHINHRIPGFPSTAHGSMTVHMNTQGNLNHIASWDVKNPGPEHAVTHPHWMPATNQELADIIKYHHLTKKARFSTGDGTSRTMLGYDERLIRQALKNIHSRMSPPAS